MIACTRLTRLLLTQHNASNLQTVSQAKHEEQLKAYLPFFHAMYGYLLSLNPHLELGQVVKTVDQ